MTSYHDNNFLQVVTTVCVGLVTDMWYVAMTPAKTVVVNGTFVGYIMLSTVIILGFVLDTPLDRKLVSTRPIWISVYNSRVW